MEKDDAQDRMDVMARVAEVAIGFAGLTGKARLLVLLEWLADQGIHVDREEFESVWHRREAQIMENAWETLTLEGMVDPELARGRQLLEERLGRQTEDDANDDDDESEERRSS
jgi:hypothetical protein